MSADAFLFSVTGPYTDAPVRFPVKADKADAALACHMGLRPGFNGGLEVSARSGPFDEGSRCVIGPRYSKYNDTIRRGKASLTGAEFFAPVEVEVCALACA